jgi:hypothetical protein
MQRNTSSNLESKKPRNRHAFWRATVGDRAQTPRIESPNSRARGCSRRHSGLIAENYITIGSR